MNGNNHYGRSGRRVAVRKFKSRRKSMSALMITAIVLAAVITVSAILIALDATHTINFRALFSRDGGETTDSEETSEPDTAGAEETTAPVETKAPETTEPEPPKDPLAVDDIKFVSVEMTYDQTKVGDLVLIDKTHEYVFPEEENAVSIVKYKTKSYGVSYNNITLRRDVIEALNDMIDEFYAETELKNVFVYSAYRTYDEQAERYEQYIENHSREEADLYSAQAGHTDYHTGASFELRYIDENRMNHKLDEDGRYAWIMENMDRYGFINRYPRDKAEITGNDFEPFHFRYVGADHAQVMKQLDELCLEEYLEEVQKHDYAGEHLYCACDEGAKVYEIYYVFGNENGTVNVPVPENYEYTISGDNCGGFVIAVDLTAPKK